MSDLIPLDPHRAKALELANHHDRRSPPISRCSRARLSRLPNRQTNRQTGDRWHDSNGGCALRNRPLRQPANRRPRPRPSRRLRPRPRPSRPPRRRPRHPAPSLRPPRSPLPPRRSLRLPSRRLRLRLLWLVKIRRTTPRTRTARTRLRTCATLWRRLRAHKAWRPRKRS